MSCHVAIVYLVAASQVLSFAEPTSEEELVPEGANKGSSDAGPVASRSGDSQPHYSCPSGCTLKDPKKGGYCRCVYPAKKVTPLSDTRVTTKYTCQIGCTLEVQNCFCAPKAILEHFVCLAGCTLEGVDCKCLSQPKSSKRRGAKRKCPVRCTFDRRKRLCACRSPAIKKTLQRQKMRYLCPKGCTLTNYMKCSCVYKARSVAPPPDSEMINYYRFVCPHGCTLRGQTCYCVDTSKTVSDEEDWTDSEYLCPQGCELRGSRMCSCIYPGLEIPSDNGGPSRRYSCPVGCNLQGRNCICAIQADRGKVLPGPNLPSDICQAGCTFQNGMCNCAYEALMIPPPPGSGDRLRFACPENCRLQGKKCLCVTPPTGDPGIEQEFTRPDDRDDPGFEDYDEDTGLNPQRPQHACQAGCTLQRGMCACTFPALRVTPPPGSAEPPRYICMISCTLQGRSCVCMSSPEDDGVSPPSANCQTGCRYSNGMCTCLYPALQLPTQPGSGRFIYICPTGCKLRGQNCYCVTRASDKRGGSFDRPRPVPSNNRCPAGCTPRNGMCACTFPALFLVPPQDSGESPQYICMPDCRLEGQQCLCISPPQDDPESDTSPACQIGCTYVSGMCSCAYPAKRMPTGSGGYVYVCPRDSSPRGRLCYTTSKALDGSDDTGVGFPKKSRWLCKICVLL